MNIVWYKYRWVQVYDHCFWHYDSHEERVVYYYIVKDTRDLIRVDDCEEWYYPLKFLLIIILATIFFVQCDKPKANLRVPYNPLYKNTECKDWQSDSTMTQGKIETLNEILAR